MSSRDAILAAIRANKPAPQPLPDVPFFDEGRDDDRLGRFVAAFMAMGGTVLEAEADDPMRQVRVRVEQAGVVVSMVPEIDGNRRISPPPCGKELGVKVGAKASILGGAAKTPSPDSFPQITPASLADVDIAIVRAAFGIAETGSVALTENELGINTLAYLAQHLIVLLDPADIVINLHHAYQRPEFASARYTVFHTGPSATADIEGVLIHGAQGVRSLSILPLARSAHPPLPKAAEAAPRYSAFDTSARLLRDR